MSDTIHVVAALIRNAEGRVLLVRKRGTAAFMQPGGKIDPGEDDTAALTRELNEELGCRPSSAAKPLGVFHAPAANEPGRQVKAAVYAVDVADAPARRRRSRRSPGSIRTRPARSCSPRSRVITSCRWPRGSCSSVLGCPHELRH